MNFRKMRIVFYMLMFSLCISGCGLADVEKVQNRAADTTEDSDLLVQNEGKEIINTSDTKETDSVNPFLHYEENVSFEYDESIWFRKWSDDVDLRDGTAVVNIDIVKKWNDTCLYKIYIAGIEDEQIPKKRLSIGFFYVEKDRITRLVENRNNPWSVSNEAINRFIKHKTLPKQSVVVCDKNGFDDEKSEEVGWHYSLETQEDKVIFSSHEQRVEGREAYFWETLVWGKSEGLVEYRCGYKAGVDYIYLKKR